MPTREDLEYAVPRCYARTMKRDGQHGVHFTCYQPMRYVAATNMWVCDSCHTQNAGQYIPHRLEYAA
jgi:hypothetical protein